MGAGQVKVVLSGAPRIGFPTAPLGWVVFCSERWGVSSIALIGGRVWVFICDPEAMEEVEVLLTDESVEVMLDADLGGLRLARWTVHVESC